MYNVGHLGHTTCMCQRPKGGEKSKRPAPPRKPCSNLRHDALLAAILDLCLLLSLRTLRTPRILLSLQCTRLA